MKKVVFYKCFFVFLMECLCEWVEVFLVEEFGCDGLVCLCDVLFEVYGLFGVSLCLDVGLFDLVL